MKFFSLVLFLVLISTSAIAQVVQKIGDTSFTIDTNSVLELESTNKGLLLPRLALTTTSSILPMTGTVASGMIVYNTATAGDVTPGFYFYNVDKWVRVADSAVIAASNITGAVAIANGGTGATTAAAALTNLGAQAAINLSSNITTDTGSTTMYPSVSAVETYVGTAITNGTPDATTLAKGKIQLAGDLSGTALSPLVAAGAIDNSKISETAEILDTKLATIATAGKVSNSATTATASNTANTIVLRDGSGNFNAGTITATSFSGSGAGLTGVTATSFSGTLPVANGGTGVTTATGSGSVVLSTSPTLVTPNLGTPSTLVGTNITGTASALNIGGNAATASTATTATNATNTAIIDDTTTNSTFYPTFVTTNTGNLPQKVASTKLSFNPSTGALTATSFSGSGAGLTGVTATSFSGTLPVANGGTGVTTATGSGSVVLSTSPTLTTPVLGVATATSINSTTIPTSKTLVVTTDKLSVLSATTSSELAGVISDETGTGSAVFAASPTFTGTPTAPTATSGTNTTQVATTAFVATAINAKVADEIYDGTTAVAPSENAVFDALAKKAPIDSPTFTGIPRAPTVTSGTNTTQVATTAFVATAIDSKVADAITDGTTAVAPSQNAVFDALALKAPIDSPTFTGTPSLPTGTVGTTQTAGNSSTALATTAFVATAVAAGTNLTNTEVVLPYKIDAKQLYAITGTFTASGTSATVTVTKPTDMTGYYTMVTYKDGKTFRKEIFSFDIVPSTNNVITGTGPYSEVYPLGTYSYVLEYFK